MKYCNRDCLNCPHDKCIDDYSKEERKKVLNAFSHKRWAEKHREERKQYQHEYYLKRKQALAEMKEAVENGLF